MGVDMKVKAIYDSEIGNITRSEKNWKDVLKVAGQLYRYEFDNIVMVTAQRPPEKSTLMADYDTWKKVGRYVKRGAKGCAIFPSRALNPRMRYIFDISDTGGKNVKLTWDLEGENLKDYVDFLVSEGQIEQYDNSDRESLKNILKQFTGTDVWFIMKEEFGDRMTELMQLSGSVIKEESKKRNGLQQEMDMEQLVYAITTMYKSEFKQKAWSLPVADLLYVGKSTNRKLALFGIKTIGDLARADEDVLNSHLGKMGSILWSFANGYDDSPVKLENTHAPIKSVGNSTTTPKDLVCDEDVKIVLYILAESVAARLRENGFRCRVVEISVRDNELFSFTRQKKIDHATNITGEIAAYAYQIFKENYNWSKPIRSVGVRGADLVTDNYWEQIDLFSSVEKREKQMKMDSAVDEIRRRFGFYSIQRGLMYRDRILSAVNAKEEHTVHPHGYFSG